jgi:hypothetical protein
LFLWEPDPNFKIRRCTVEKDGSLAKFFILLILLLGAAFYFPQTRPMMLDVLAPVLNPVLTSQTTGEIQQINRELQTLTGTGQSIPTPGVNFQDWMNRNFQGGSSLDAWGNPYSLRVWRDSVGVVSRGPDQEINTPDDIFHSIGIFRTGRR